MNKNSIYVRNVLFFGPKRRLKEFKSRVGFASKRRFWSTFKLFERVLLVHSNKKTMDQNCIFKQFINHVIGKSPNMRFWSIFYCSNGPKAAFEKHLSNNLKVDQNRLLTRDHKFWKRKQSGPKSPRSNFYT